MTPVNLQWRKESKPIEYWQGLFQMFAMRYFPLEVMNCIGRKKLGFSLDDGYFASRCFHKSRSLRINRKQFRSEILAFHKVLESEPLLSDTFNHIKHAEDRK